MAKSDLINMGVSVVSYVIKDISDEHVQRLERGLDSLFRSIVFLRAIFTRWEWLEQLRSSEMLL